MDNWVINAIFDGQINNYVKFISVLFGVLKNPKFGLLMLSVRFIIRLVIIEILFRFTFKTLFIETFRFGYNFIIPTKLISDDFLHSISHILVFHLLLLPSNFYRI